MTHGATSSFQIPIKESMGMRRLGGRFLRIPISASAGSPAHGRSSSSHSSESRGWLGYAATLAHRGCGPSKIGSQARSGFAQDKQRQHSQTLGRRLVAVRNAEVSAAKVVSAPARPEGAS